MSDDIERRLRDAGNSLPVPDDVNTAVTRARVLAAGTPARERRPRRRPLAIALVAALAIGGAFGVGFAIASGNRTTTTRIVERTRPLDAGPGFLPATGWDSVTSGTSAPTLAAVASNVALSPGDRRLAGPPAETARRLGPNGVLFYATFGPALLRGGPPQRLLPLQLEDAKRGAGVAGMPPVGATERLRARVAAYDVDVLILFGSAHPSAGVLAAAREELGRLVVPACPDAEPLAAGDADRAGAHLLQWLPAHYSGDASEVHGATASAEAGAAAARHGEAAHDCGRLVADRSVEVDVTLPALAKVSASLSQLTYFLARTSAGWVVWERAR